MNSQQIRNKFLEFFKNVVRDATPSEMEKIKKISDFNLNSKKVLVRLDLNVPLKKGIITDETRIDKILPIFQYLLEKKSKIRNLFEKNKNINFFQLSLLL